MKYIELFAGIGGFRKGFEGYGECVFASEIDKFAQRSYKAIHGDNGELHGDIFQINAKDIPDHDLLLGGFPCQAFSVAGKRGGFNDARGTLFFEVARIMDEKQPKMAILENVKGLVGHDKGKTLDTIVKVLNQIGYRVDFEVLNSKYFGVPQNRERIFIVAVREDLIEQQDWIIVGNNVVAKGKRRIIDYDDVKMFNFDFPVQTNVEKRLKDILQNEVEDKYYLDEQKSGKLIEQLKEKECLSDSDEPEKLGSLYDKKQAGTMWGVGGVSPTIKTSSGGYSEPIVPEMVGLVDIKGNENVRRVYSDDGLSPTVTACGGGHKEPKVLSVGNLNPSGKGMNGSVYDIKSGLSPTITTNKGEGQKIKEDIKIRKLTPLECWRLQGFTDKDHQKAVDEGISNSQRYKQAGNAVTVNVIQSIAEKSKKYLEG